MMMKEDLLMRRQTGYDLPSVAGIFVMWKQFIIISAMSKQITQRYKHEQDLTTWP